MFEQHDVLETVHEIGPYSLSPLLVSPLKQICNKVNIALGHCDCHKAARNIDSRSAADLLLPVKNKYGSN